MVAYSVVDWVSAVGNLAVVMAAFETYIETVDDTKTIYASGVVKVGQETFQAYIVHLA